MGIQSTLCSPLKAGCNVVLVLPCPAVENAHTCCAYTTLRTYLLCHIIGCASIIFPWMRRARRSLMGDGHDHTAAGCLLPTDTAGHRGWCDRRPAPLAPASLLSAAPPQISPDIEVTLTFLGSRRPCFFVHRGVNGAIKIRIIKGDDARLPWRWTSSDDGLETGAGGCKHLIITTEKIA